MARVLNITSGTLTVDLMDGVFHMSDGSWSVKSATDVVWETIDLFSTATDATIRGEIANLELLWAQARRYADNAVESVPVWFTWQSAGESVKRSLVMDGTYEILQTVNTGPMLGRNRLIIRVAIERQATYETNTASTQSPGNLSATGGKAILSTIGGQIDGRIASLSLSSNASGVPNLSRIWVGLRAIRAGASSFVALWELESGYPNTAGGDCQTISDGTASGGSYVRANFVTGGMYNRVSITVGSVAVSNFDHFRGRYLVLGRLRVDAGTTQVAIQLRQGWYGWNQAAVVGTTYISGQTSWRLVELGQIQIPTTTWRDSGPNIGNGIQDYGLQVYAERLSAGGTLHLDALILIPAEHLFIADGASIGVAGGSIGAYTSPQDGDQYAVGAQPNNILANIEYSLTEWVYPYDGALLVVAGQGPSAHELAPQINPQLSIISRWRGLRT